MLTDKARKIKDNMKIGESITVEYLEGEIKQKQKAKVYNVSDIYFTTDKSTAIYYNDIINIIKQNELF